MRILIPCLEIQIEDVVAVATLLKDKAPKTCRAILRALPIEGVALHNMWSGEGIYIQGTYIDKITSINIPPENQTIFPSRGDIGISTFGFKEINIVYNRCQFRGPDGDQPNNIFARITENLEEFQKMCKKIHLEGKKRIILREKE